MVLDAHRLGLAQIAGPGVAFGEVGEVAEVGDGAPSCGPGEEYRTSHFGDGELAQFVGVGRAARRAADAGTGPAVRGHATSRWCQQALRAAAIALSMSAGVASAVWPMTSSRWRADDVESATGAGYEFAVDQQIGGDCRA